MKKSLMLIAIAIAFPTNLLASPIINSDTGISDPKTIIDFGADLYNDGTIITDQFDGVIFGFGYAYLTIGSSPGHVSGGFLYNALGNFPPTSIFFTEDVTAAAFSWRDNSSSTTFSAYLDGILAETFTVNTLDVTTRSYYGFEDILFDEIQIIINFSNRNFHLDNLQFKSAVPVPSAVWLFGSGLLGLVGLARRKSDYHVV